MSQHNLPELPARWYSVDSAGAATLCVDESDATRQAEQNNKMYPRFAPHRAVKLSALSEQGAGEAVATAWAVYDSQGFYELHVCEDTAKKWCDKYNARDVDPLKPYTYRKCQLFEPRPQAAQPARVVDLLDWAVSRWNDEVKHRPLVNKNRRTLDDTWRQVIRFAGGNPDDLVGPSHDALLSTPPAAPAPSQQADHSPDGGNMVEQQAGEVTELRAALWHVKNTAKSLADAQVIALEALAAYEAKKAGGVL